MSDPYTDDTGYLDNGDGSDIPTIQPTDSRSGEDRPIQQHVDRVWRGLVRAGDAAGRNALNTVVAELSSLRFSVREWRDRARDMERERDEAAAELLVLREALERAYDHLRFNGWKGDPGSDKRLVAVQEVERALTTHQETS
jgi:hypothetical protein